jgi:pimeloyl-ACP methyl ester carboxylesterase
MRKTLVIFIMCVIFSSGKAAGQRRDSTAGTNNSVSHRSVNIDGLDIFYREAGPENAPVILLMHGFPSSSFMYRDLIDKLKEEFHVIAPDYPNFGFSTFEPSINTFDGLASVMEKFVDKIRLRKFSIYIQDYGSPVGLRLVARRPEMLECLIVQNGNAYEEGLGKPWDPIKVFWKNPANPIHRKTILDFFELPITKFQYLAGVGDTTKVRPENYHFDQFLLNRPGAKELQLQLMLDYQNNIKLYPEWQKMFQTYQPPTLIVWGENDPFFTKAGALAYARDLKRTEYHFYPTGHFALEEYGSEIAASILSFLKKNVK